MDQCWYLFELLSPLWEGSGAKGKPSGFQKPLWEDFGGILVPIGVHLGTLLDNKLAQGLFRDAFWEVLGEVSKKHRNLLNFLPSPTLWIELTLTR